MPGFNGKGPLGEGPATGGGFGKCNRPMPEAATNIDFADRPGRGMGRGRGVRAGRGAGAGAGRCRPRGRGRGWGRQAEPDGSE